ncbi:UDP-N-acetylmuramate dehydrogenase [Candidatus Peregrinibacteria bacterium]|nr:UDP-N-acetylmuramate dehydrogenase [Candidatus Peregrinibacteria bacterium]
MLFGKIKKQFPLVRQNEPLKNHCSFRVGGPADAFYELKNIEELPPLITLAEENNIPYKIIGRGTNILFTDKEFRGLIIKNITNNCVVNGDEISADSGVILAQIIRLSIDNNLNGLEFFYGIPGTIGGAVYGNAGVPGTEIGSFVKSLTLFNASDGVREDGGNDVKFGYRESSLQQTHDIILRVTLKLNPAPKNLSQELLKKINEIRRGKQPSGYSAGSFFKNPSPDLPAGYLIDQTGLKGYVLGDAEISQKHANFFINRGHATAKDLLALMHLAQEKVKAKFKIELEPEVKIIGEL